MQFHSFDTRDPLFEIGRWRISFQVITLENTYGLDPDHTTLAETADGWRVTCHQLAWAGQQQRAPGSLTATITREDDMLRISVSADAPANIRCVKILLRDLPELMPVNLPPPEIEDMAEGVVRRYPSQLRLPLVCIADPAGHWYGFRSEDPQARAKRFAFYAERHGPLAGQYAVELIHEEDARHFANHMDVPDWIIGVVPDQEVFIDEQLAFNETHLDLVRWEDRADVPDWTRDISLVLTIHGMHWTGYTFNTYDNMRAILRFVAERIDGGRVLALLPGWEGRYYWQYADYRPDPLLGGADGFARLADEARSLGVHLMPFFGVTCANCWHSPDFDQYGSSARMKSPTRNTFWGNQPDWDTARGQDTGWQAWLNIGAASWRDELARQITRTIDGYDLDAVFLDCTEVWINDPDHNIREGLYALTRNLRATRTDLLVTGEDWWDGILGALAMCQHPRKWRDMPAWAGRYARFFEHIADAEPSRGSTGVFESGFSLFDPLPLERMYIPTVSFVDGTLEKSPAKVEMIIEKAKRYADIFLAG